MDKRKREREEEKEQTRETENRKEEQRGHYVFLLLNAGDNQILGKMFENVYKTDVPCVPANESTTYVLLHI